MYGICTVRGLHTPSAEYCKIGFRFCGCVLETPTGGDKDVRIFRSTYMQDRMLCKMYRVNSLRVNVEQLGCLGVIYVPKEHREKSRQVVRNTPTSN